MPRRPIRLLVVLVAMAALVSSGCERGRSKARCRGTGWGDDGGSWILRCQGGRWVRVITKADYARILLARPTTTTPPTTSPTPVSSPPSTVAVPAPRSASVGVDPTFGGGVPVVANGLVLLGLWGGPGGSVLVGLREADGVGITIIRLGTDGFPDPTFGIAGRIDIPEATSATVDTSARAWVFGSEARTEDVTIPGQPLRTDRVVTKWAQRFTTAGVPDATLGLDGRRGFPERRVVNDLHAWNCVARPSPVGDDVVLVYVGNYAERCSSTFMDRVSGSTVTSPWGPSLTSDLGGAWPIAAAAGPSGLTVTMYALFDRGHLVWLRSDGTVEVTRGATATPGRTVARGPSGVPDSWPNVVVMPLADGSVAVDWVNTNSAPLVAAGWKRFLPDGDVVGRSPGLGALAATAGPGWIAEASGSVAACTSNGGLPCTLGPGVSFATPSGTQKSVRLVGASGFEFALGWGVSGGSKPQMALAWTDGRLFAARTDTSGVTTVTRFLPFEVL